MRIEKVRQTLRKVQALVENMGDHDSTSSLERDLLLRYLRDIYEDIALDRVEQPEHAVHESNFGIDVQEQQADEPNDVEDEELPEDANPQIPGNPDQQVTYYDAQSETSADDEMSETGPSKSDEEAPLDASLHRFQNPVRYFPKGPADELPTAPPAAGKVNEPADDLFDIEVKVEEPSEQLLSIFEIKTTGDLAEHPSFHKVESLDRSMGINERIMAINELFGGDNRFFNEVMQKLNEIDNFQEARELLLHGPAMRFKWDAEDKRTHASKFIRLVHRRYL